MKAKAAKPGKLADGEKRGAGRPSIYTPALAEAVCAHMMDGKSLRKIEKEPGMPSRATILRWLAANTDDFEARYAHARVAQMMGEADDLLELADESRVGVKTTTKANGDVETVQIDMVERARLQLETRKWLLERLMPKKYGQKLDIEHSGGVKLSRDLSDAELMAIAAGKAPAQAEENP